MKRTSLIILAAAIALGGALTYFSGKGGRSSAEAQTIKLPKNLSSLAREGNRLFEANCATCHGKNAVGTKNGPPLIHIIYETSHHSDNSFYRAVKQGVRQHHWPFGNMPPLPNVKEDEVTAIIKYIREVQQENGIF